MHLYEYNTLPAPPTSDLTADFYLRAAYTANVIRISNTLMIPAEESVHNSCPF